MYIARLQVEFYGAWDSNDDIAILRDTPANLLNLVAGGEERHKTHTVGVGVGVTEKTHYIYIDTYRLYIVPVHTYMYPGIVEIRHNS